MNTKTVNPIQYGDTPLHIACKMQDIELIGALCDSGEDVNAVNDDGDTPLHIACKLRNLRMVKAINNGKGWVESGIRNKDGEIPLEIAVKHEYEGNNLEVLRYLMDNFDDHRH